MCIYTTRLRPSQERVPEIRSSVPPASAWAAPVTTWLLADGVQIAAGALFLIGAVLALLNLRRNKKRVHLFIALFGLGESGHCRREDVAPGNSEDHLARAAYHGVLASASRLLHCGYSRDSID